MKIPIVMSHGIAPEGKCPITIDYFDHLMKIAFDLDFESISYDELEAWRAGKGDVPRHPFMIDFDHPMKSLRYEVFEVLNKYGFKGNVFINTSPLDDMYSRPLPPFEQRSLMTWEEIGELLDAGWTIGNHTVTHPQMSALALEDPAGEKIRLEFEGCDETIKKHLNMTPKDLAYPGNYWSSLAEKIAQKRYRFARLWIVAPHYVVDGNQLTRFADLVGVQGLDESDGGPPIASRYITKETNPYRLPSMELQAEFFYGAESYKKYIEYALTFP